MTLSKASDSPVPEIEFVYFDLGNILLKFDPALACQGLADLVGGTAEQARQMLYESGLEEEYEHGRVSSRQFADQLRDSFGRDEVEASDQAIIESISDMFEPVEAMTGIMAAVRATGRRVGLLSNTCEGHWQWIGQRQFDVMDFDFDELILSFEIGSMKPDRAIYAAAEAAAAVPVDRILFLDDRSENVAAAQARGWQAVECLGGQPAIDALKEHRVLDTRN